MKSAHLLFNIKLAVLGQLQVLVIDAKEIIPCIFSIFSKAWNEVSEKPILFVGVLCRFRDGSLPIVEGGERRIIMNSLARLEIRTKWQEMQNKQDQLKDISKDSESETETDFLDAREVYRIDPI